MLVCPWILLGYLWQWWQMLSQLMLFFTLADVIANYVCFCGWSYCHGFRLMLLPLLLTCGWCCYHIGVFNNSCWDLADVNANAFFLWQMVLPYMWKMVNHMVKNICQSSPTLGGCSICHHGNNICQAQNTKNCGLPSSTYMAIPSATKKKALALTSAKSQHELLKTPMW